MTGRFLLLTVFVGFGRAQTACPQMTLQNEASASLKPSATSHIRMARQPDGSYTGYQMADAAPYRTIRVTPNFERQVNLCALTNQDYSIAPNEASMRLATGDYLVVSTVSPGAQFGAPIRAQLFDSSMRLETELSYPATASPLALADLNGDGKPDIVGATAAQRSAYITVLLGSGGASFGAPAIYGSAALDAIFSLAVADLDGDGRADVIIAGRLKGEPGSKIAVLYGNGDGSFQPPVELAIGWGPQAIAVADVNRDGRPDLVFTSGSYGDGTQPIVAVKLGKGNREFADPVNYAVGGNGSASVAIGDMDGDGKLDVVTSGVSVLFGDGAGGFPRRRDFWNDAPGNVILHDFDHDGKTDIVIAAGTPQLLSGNRIAVLYNRGGGEFSGAPGSVVPDLRYRVYQLGGFDFNRDGILDLLVGGYTELAVLLGDGRGRFTPSYVYGPSAVSTPAVAVADFNGDGILDLAASRDGAPGPYNVAIFLGGGGGTFYDPTLYPMAWHAEAIAAADFDGDGKADVAVAVHGDNFGSSDAVLIYSGNGNGGLAAPVSYPVGPVAMGLTVGDFNRDGRPDIAVAAEGTYPGGNGEVTLLLSKKGGGFTRSAVPVPGAPYTVTAADLNRDGAPDLAFETLEGRAGIALGRGDGTFAAPSYLRETGPNGTFEAFGVGVADLNRDAVPDLFIWGNLNGVFLGNGDGSFQPEIPLPNAFGAWAAADWDGDGAPDLVMGEYRTGVVAFRNTGAPPAALAVVNAATMRPGAIASDSLATVFGAGLTGAVTVTDASGTARTSQILYNSPAQINFVVPPGSVPGTGTVAVGSKSVPVSIALVAPALFSVAVVTTVAPDGSRTDQVLSGPIDLGPPGTQVYLQLFATGLRRAGSDVSVTIQGVNAPVTYAGPQGVVAGLDQVNVLMPRELAGSGEVSVVVTAGDVTADTLRLSVR